MSRTQYQYVAVLQNFVVFSSVFTRSGFEGEESNRGEATRDTEADEEEEGRVQSEVSNFSSILSIPLFIDAGFCTTRCLSFSEALKRRYTNVYSTNYTNTQIYYYTRTCVHISTHSHIQAHTHANIHTHAHTYL